MRLKTDQKWIRSYSTINAVAIFLTNRFTLVFPYLLLIFVAWLCQCWICVDSSSDFLWLLFIRFTFNLSWNGERNWCYFNNNQLMEPSSQSIWEANKYRGNFHWALNLLEEVHFCQFCTLNYSSFSMLSYQRRPCYEFKSTSKEHRTLHWQQIRVAAASPFYIYLLIMSQTEVIVHISKVSKSLTIKTFTKLDYCFSISAVNLDGAGVLFTFYCYFYVQLIFMKPLNSWFN